LICGMLKCCNSVTDSAAAASYTRSQCRVQARVQAQPAHLGCEDKQLLQHA
jgi:hypothetical protein